MHRHVWIAALIGWGLAAVFPPGKLLAMFKGRG